MTFPFQNFLGYQLQVFGPGGGGGVLQEFLGRFGFKKSISHRNSEMETKLPDFVSTMSRSIKCNHCSKLFDNQQGLSVHEKCVHGVRQRNDKDSQNYIYPFENLSLGFIFKIFLKFRKFQPRYFSKIYSYKKKRVQSSNLKL